jgi:hypothetical protein
MRVRSRISFTAPEDRARELLSKYGLRSENKDNSVVHVFVDDRNYKAFMSELVQEDYHPIEFKEPVFTKKEMESAEYFEVVLVAQWGYPQPEDDFGYEKLSFDRSTTCPLCGEGATQTKPYHISGHPKFGRNEITALFWTYDLLITQRLKDLIEDSNLTGAEFWPLLEYPDQGHTERIVGAYELYIGNELPPAAPSTEFPIVKRLPRGKKPCTCGRLGRNLPIQFHYKRKDLAEAKDFNKTHEWVGGGLGTTRAVIVGRNVYELFIQNKIRGIKFSAVAIED